MEELFSELHPYHHTEETQKRLVLTVRGVNICGVLLSLAVTLANLINEPLVRESRGNMEV